jgi:hypothetical protein
VNCPHGVKPRTLSICEEVIACNCFTGKLG